MDNEVLECDAVIVGAGAAGLAAAIRLKQLNAALSVIVLEKGADIGAHILSGAVIDPIGMDKLLPGWRKDADNPCATAVKTDVTRFLTRRRAFTLPHFLLPKMLSNRGNYIASLGALCRFLAQKAEALGVDIFPGFAAAEAVYDKNGACIGVRTGAMGLKADGGKGPNYQPGMELRGKYILAAEGARGSLTEQLIARYGLDKQAEPQKYGLGLKEIWEISPERHCEGRAEHYLGWPLGNKATGGGFAYHMAGNRLALGLVVHLDYKNPYLSPFDEFQQWKTHPALQTKLKDGKRLAYGARVINEGGWQSVPRLSFKGGALIGCAAGFVNLPRVKGSHNAILSGIAAAEAAAAAIAAGRAHDELSEIETGWRASAIGRDLRPARNFKPLLERCGTLWGMALGGLDLWCGQLFFGRSPFGTLRHKSTDAAALRPAARCKKLRYPKADNIYSFDKASSVYLANISARDDAPCHLLLRDAALQQNSEWGVFAGPSARYCPAAVYEWQEEQPRGKKGKSGKAAGEAMRYRINAANCIHCKTCAVKDPNNNIKWTVPEGGSGPIYGDM